MDELLEKLIYSIVPLLFFAIQVLLGVVFKVFQKSIMKCQKDNNDLEKKVDGNSNRIIVIEKDIEAMKDDIGSIQGDVKDIKKEFIIMSKSNSDMLVSVDRTRSSIDKATEAILKASKKNNKKGNKK